ncbi:MAG: peptide chain release factor 1 [Chloroflexi bacterium]|nr:peptide chain release factor 1 [Chloroflexota bacterium]
MGREAVLEKVARLERRYQEIDGLLASPSVASDYVRVAELGRERSGLEPVVGAYREYRKVETALADARSLALESRDPELVQLARDEAASLEARREALEEGLRLALLPRDPADERDVIVEVRAAAGGDEAALFAAELYRMYTRYAQGRGWNVELIDVHQTGLAGVKEVIFEVRGKDVYSRLKHESGVHRVQRVPVTEASGRIHTSTVTVAVLPEAEDVEVKLKDDDLRVDIFHAGGHGGQNVNKVATAVRITHRPTGIVAVCQDERSQLRNKQKALTVLKARLLDRAQREQHQQITQERRAQVGTGDRAEKARTYNFPQDRVTDHRVNLTLRHLQGVLDGGLDPLIEPLMADERSRKLEALVA